MRARSLTALVLAAVAATALVAGFAGRGPSAPAAGVLAGGPPVPRLFGVESKDGRVRLVRVDRRTLRPRAGARVALGSEGCAPRSGGQACWAIPPWSFSPNRSRLAIARHETGVVRALRIVDPARMRAVTDIAIKPSGAVGLVAWPSPNRLLAVQEVCCVGQQQLVVVDAARRRIVARRPLGGTVERVGRTARWLVLLVAPSKRIGVSRVAVIDGRGRLRFARLERLAAGEQRLAGADLAFRRRLPGLAVDPRGRRAFVVGSNLVATVDLEGLGVSYHRLTQRRSLTARIRDWLDPAAYAKGQSGPTRTAAWLGGGRLAVAGADRELFTDARGVRQQRGRPAGLSLVDTRDWTYRTIDSGATAVRVAGRLLLATGESLGPGPDAKDPTGLAAYGFDGERRFALFEDREAWIEQVVGRRAYVTAGGAQRDGAAPPLRVVDLANGRVSGERASSPPTLLLQPAWSWWEE